MRVGDESVRDGMIAAFHAMAAPMRLSEKLLLSLPEPSTLSGSPVADLRAAVHAGKLKTMGVGRGLGKVRRSDLEKYVSKL